MTNPEDVANEKATTTPQGVRAGRIWPSAPRLLVGAAIGLGATVWIASLYLPGTTEAAQGTGQEAGKEKYDFYGASSCRTCHKDSKTAKLLSLPVGLVRYDEYETWKTKDRHSQAYAVLAGPRGKRMADILKIKVTDPKEGAMCLACHTTTFLPGHEGQQFSLADGVSCDGCHGPAGRWFAPHQEPVSWRPKSPVEKEAKDMFNIRDPWKRADLCTSCHVGSPAEGKVVTHAMYAAGHPPLPSFELASFSKNLPPHWFDLTATKYFMDKKNDPKVKKDYHLDTAKYQHTKLVLAGSVVVARKTMELIAARADMGPLPKEYAASPSWPPRWFQGYYSYEDKKRWPELEIGERLKTVGIDLPAKPAERWPEIAMGQADCYACHHELKFPSWRQARGYPGRPGRPQFQSWAMTLAPLTLNPEDEKAYRSLLKELRDAFDSQPFGASSEVAAAAKRLAGFFEKRSNKEITVDDDIAKNCLAKLTSPEAIARPEFALAVDRGKGKKEFDRDYLDFDSARQIAWAFRAIFMDHWNDGKVPERKKILSILQDLDKDLNLTIDTGIRKECAKDRQTLMGNKAIYESSMKDLLAGPGTEKFLGELWRINEEELRGNLTTVGSYEPVRFRKQTAELGRLLKR